MDSDIILAVFANAIFWVFFFDASIISYMMKEDITITLIIAGGLILPLAFHTINTFYMIWRYRRLKI